MDFTSIGVNTTPASGLAAAHLAPPEAAQLRAAAQVYASRTDSFAAGKAATCEDIALKLERFGSFASDKQAEFARKLIQWAQPRTAPAVHLGSTIGGQVAPAVDPNVLAVPSLFAVMQRHATFHVGAYKISRRNQDSLCWISTAQGAVGKLDAGTAHLWPRKATERGADIVALRALLVELEANPLVAMKYGKLSGAAARCGRDLTDPESIERGIGPICAEKFN